MRRGTRRDVEPHLGRTQRVQQSRDASFGVFLCERQDAFAQRFVADVLLRVLPRAAFHADVGAAKDAGAAVDDVRGAVVDARDENLRRRQMDDDSSSNSGSGNSNAFMIPSGTISAATYAIDSTVPGSGRGTLQFTDSKLGTFSFIFYLISPTQAVIQDNSAGIVSDGSIGEIVLPMKRH